ncbi:MAG: PKD domain-containing protein [Parcubacteria group bacterium Gr01-1014_8]|nr:MAG: PKD domain-containing protein [Parcubacteria group bacterium Gr01-1014_8]
MKKLFAAFGFALVLAPALASAQLSSTPWGPDALAAPQNLQAICNAAGDEVTLSWSPAANATYYSVRVNIPGNADFVHAVSTRGETTITLPISPNQEYAWWVHSNNASNPLGPYTIGPRFTCHTQTLQTPTFSASPTSGVVPLAVTFTFSGTGNTYRVYFGDGASQDLHPECYTGGGCEFPHTYASAGTYTASLRTTAGATVASVSISVTSPLTSGTSCTLDGVTVAHGATRKFYLHRDEVSSSQCQTNSIDRTCNNGVLSGATSYQYAACTWPEGNTSPSITITAPPSGSSVQVNNPVTISWQSQNAPANAQVILSWGPYGAPMYGIGGIQPLSGSYVWTPTELYLLAGNGGIYATLRMPNYQVLAQTNIPFTITAAGTPPPFAVGDRVRATDAVNVRATPSTSGTILGAQPTGAEGTIIDGPQSANSYTWWKINWDNSPIDGWSVQNYIAKVSNTNTYSLIPTPAAGLPYSFGLGVKGPNDIFQGQVDWGDGSPYGTVTPQNCNNNGMCAGYATGGHAYTASGTYTVRLLIGGVVRATVAITAPHTNQNTLTATPSSGPAPLATNLAFTVTQTLLAFRINFGDGTPIHQITAAEKSCTGTGPCSGTIVHTYTTPGSYTAKLLANGGYETATAAVNVTGGTTPPPFAIGDRVRATDAVNVRATPSTSGAILDAQPTGAEGTIIDGPQSANGFTWWKIDWDNSTIDGWSVQNYIVKVYPPPPPDGSSCTLDGVTIQNGQSRIFYSNRWGNCSTTGSSLSRTCTNGTLSGNAAYRYAYCSDVLNSLNAVPSSGSAPLTVHLLVPHSPNSGGVFPSIDFGDGTPPYSPPYPGTDSSYPYYLVDHIYTSPGTYTVHTFGGFTYDPHETITVTVTAPTAAAQNHTQLANSLTALESALKAILQLLGR